MMILEKEWELDKEKHIKVQKILEIRSNFRNKFKEKNRKKKINKRMRKMKKKTISIWREILKEICTTNRKIPTNKEILNKKKEMKRWDQLKTKIENKI